MLNSCPLIFTNICPWKPVQCWDHLSHSSAHMRPVQLQKWQKTAVFTPSCWYLEASLGGKRASDGNSCCLARMLSLDEGKGSARNYLALAITCVNRVHFLLVWYRRAGKPLLPHHNNREIKKTFSSVEEHLLCMCEGMALVLCTTRK